MIVVTSHELVNELSDEKRFKKYIGSSLTQVRYVYLNSFPTILSLDRSMQKSGWRWSVHGPWR